PPRRRRGPGCAVPPGVEGAAGATDAAALLVARRTGDQHHLALRAAGDLLVGPRGLVEREGLDREMRTHLAGLVERPELVDDRRAGGGGGWGAAAPGHRGGGGEKIEEIDLPPPARGGGVDPQPTAVSEAAEERLEDRGPHAVEGDVGAVALGRL